VIEIFEVEGSEAQVDKKYVSVSLDMTSSISFNSRDAVKEYEGEFGPRELLMNPPPLPLSIYTGGCSARLSKCSLLMTTLSVVSSHLGGMSATTANDKTGTSTDTGTGSAEVKRTRH
jgi:hypothetical protein